LARRLQSPQLDSIRSELNQPGKLRILAYKPRYGFRGILQLSGFREKGKNNRAMVGEAPGLIVLWGREDIRGNLDIN